MLPPILRTYSSKLEQFTGIFRLQNIMLLLLSFPSNLFLFLLHSLWTRLTSQTWKWWHTSPSFRCSCWRQKRMKVLTHVSGRWRSPKSTVAAAPVNSEHWCSTIFKAGRTLESPPLPTPSWNSSTWSTETILRYRDRPASSTARPVLGGRAHSAW